MCPTSIKDSDVTRSQEAGKSTMEENGKAIKELEYHGFSSMLWTQSFTLSEMGSFESRIVRPSFK